MKRIPIEKVEKKFDPRGAEIIKAMEEVDPKNKTFYGNKGQREACDNLIREYGLENVLQVISILPLSNAQPYSPVITSPFELFVKWVKLSMFIQKKKNESTNRGRGFA